MFLVEAEILSNVKVAGNIYHLTFKAPEIALKAQPGQFIHVRCTDRYDPLLRRPFSVYMANHRAGTVEILYKVVGAGTAALAGKRRGETLSVLGPLGKGFNVEGVQDSALLVGEGVGTASLMLLARELRRCKVKVDAILGGKTKEEIIGEDLLKALGVTVRTVWGKRKEYQQEMVNLFEEALKGGVKQAFGCGSNHLLAETARIAGRLKASYQVSLYQAMACGIGACLCCARKFRKGAQTMYRLVCKDGPVFNSQEVLWEV